MAGRRGAKDVVRDLEEAISAIQRDIEMIKEKQNARKKQRS